MAANEEQRDAATDIESEMSLLAVSEASPDIAATSDGANPINPSESLAGELLSSILSSL